MHSHCNSVICLFGTSVRMLSLRVYNRCLFDKSGSAFCPYPFCMDEHDLSENDAFYQEYKTRRLNEMQALPELTQEKDLIEKTHNETMIVHFYDETFQSCIVMNKELNKLHTKYDTINFYKIKATLCPVITSKLDIKVLPFLGFFKDGYFVDQLIGFEEMGDERFDSKKLRHKIESSNIFKPVSFIK